MAVTLTDTPAQTREGESILFFTASNVLNFEFTASGSPEPTSVQLQLCNSGGTAVATLKTVPFFNSIATVDFSPYLNDQLTNDDNTDNSRQQGQFDAGTGKAYTFTLKYRENGTGAYSSIGGTYIAVNACRQLGSTFGSTVAEYLPLMSGSPAGVDFTGKWLTLFEKPTLFWYSDKVNPSAVGDVSVWYGESGFPLNSDDYTDIDLLRSRWYAGGSLVATFETSDSGTSSPIITTTVNNAEAYVWQADEVIMDAGIGDGGAPPAMQTVAIDAITFKVRRACNNPVAVKWLNSLGIWECWVFEGRSPRELETESTGQYGLFPVDLTTATSTGRNFNKTARQALSVSADNLELQEVRALTEILTSPNVLLFVGALTAGTAFEDWHEVIVDAGSYAIEDTYDSKHKMEFTMLLPFEFTISN